MTLPNNMKLFFFSILRRSVQRMNSVPRIQHREQQNQFIGKNNQGFTFHLSLLYSLLENIRRFKILVKLKIKTTTYETCEYKKSHENIHKALDSKSDYYIFFTHKLEKGGCYRLTGL